MGAISSSASLPILQEYLTDSNRSVRETCEIAIAKIEWDNSDEGKRHTEGLSDSTIPYVLSTHLYTQALTIGTLQVVHVHRSSPTLFRTACRNTKARRRIRWRNPRIKSKTAGYVFTTLRTISRHVRAPECRHTRGCRRACVWLLGRQRVIQVRYHPPVLFLL